MKKLLSLLLCIVLVCLTFVGCAEDVIGEYLENYNTNKVTDDKIEKLNFYIITGDNTSPEAKITVPQNINAYLKEKYEIELDIKYCTADEYSSVVAAAINSTNEAERPDIVLVNSKSMFDALYAEDRLVALNDFYNHRDFRSINTIIDRALLNASSVVDNESGVPTYYTVPNNHVVGEYKYVVINKSLARDILHFDTKKIAAMTDETALSELRAAIEDYYDSASCTTELSKEDFIAENVKIVSGSYSDKVLLEYGVSSANEITENAVAVNFVNVNSYPNATQDEAFLSAFAIVKNLSDVGNLTEEAQATLTNHYTKCMKIIYALNTDAQLKNMLQYGYVGTNYRFVKNNKNENTNYIRLEKGAEVIYNMNPIYTGNLFISYYCEEIGWNETIHSNILRQNADAKTPMQKGNAELSALVLDVTDVNADTVISLPMFGKVYSDIVYTWASSNTDVAVIDENGILTFKQPEAKTTVDITATIEIAGITGTKTFSLTVNTQ